MDEETQIQLSESYPNIEEADKLRYNELALIYVTQASFNAAEAMRIYNREHGIEDSPSLVKNACRTFRNPYVKDVIAAYQKEMRETYDQQRDINIALLNNIATDLNQKPSVRISAIKELNNMFGYNYHNVNMFDGNVTFDVVLID